jgi:hypothetical protein
VKDANENKTRPDGAFFELTADVLRGKQSVRATFKLPSEVIALLSVAANQLGLKQKSLFDQLVKDREVLEQAAVAMGSGNAAREQRQQKTYVVSRDSVLVLDAVAKTYGVPRDILVEISINRLVPVLNAEIEKQKKRKQVLAEMEEYLLQGLDLLNRTEQVLGTEDPATRHLEGMLALCRRNIGELRQQVERGRVI